MKARENPQDETTRLPDILPVLPLKDAVLYPFIIVPLSLGRESSIRAVDQSLAENRGPLIAQNMLQKGHERTAAEQEIDRVLAALRFFEGASLGLTVGDASLDLAVEVRLAGGN